MFQQFGAFNLTELDVGIVKQRSQVVVREAGAHSLEIDQVSLAIAQQNILRLEITMYQNPWQPR
jgi:hypothetical protein